MQFLKQSIGGCGPVFWSKHANSQLLMAERRSFQYALARRHPLRLCSISWMAALTTQSPLKKTRRASASLKIRKLEHPYNFFCHLLPGECCVPLEIIELWSEVQKEVNKSARTEMIFKWVKDLVTEFEKINK